MHHAFVDFSLTLTDPMIIAGIFVGAMVPFMFAALTMGAVSDAAHAMVEEVRRQFREIKGIMEYEAEPEYDKCVAISTQSVREIARLRARRAARLSAEAAAGRRRLLISAVLAALTLVVGVVAYATALTWPWTLIPGALLAASLVASRVAAVRSEKIGAAELELLNELREKVSPSASRASADSASADSASAIDEAGAGIRQAETSDAPLNEGAASVLVDDAEERTVEAPVEDAADAESVESAEAPAEDVPAFASAEASEVDPIAETAPVERRTWNVASVPAPTYAIRGRISGRSVHPDTDLRGIPKVEARVPARPVRASALSGARSTSEVVADQAVALDLDAVLDARRAQ